MSLSINCHVHGDRAFPQLQRLLQSLDYVSGNKYQLFLLTLQTHLSVCPESVPQTDLCILSDRMTDRCVSLLLGVSVPVAVFLPLPRSLPQPCRGEHSGYYCLLLLPCLGVDRQFPTTAFTKCGGQPRWWQYVRVRKAVWISWTPETSRNSLNQGCNPFGAFYLVEAS